MPGSYGEMGSGDTEMPGSWWRVACTYKQSNRKSLSQTRSGLTTEAVLRPQHAHGGRCMPAFTHAMCMHAHAHNYSGQVFPSLFYIIFNYLWMTFPPGCRFCGPGALPVVYPSLLAVRIPTGRVCGAERESTSLVSLLKALEFV